MSFKIGDEVEIIGCSCAANLKYVGTTGVISDSHTEGGKTWYEIPGTGNDWPAYGWAERHLRHKPPSNYDGNSAGDWDLCPFQPYKQMERVT